MMKWRTILSGLQAIASRTLTLVRSQSKSATEKSSGVGEKDMPKVLPVADTISPEEKARRRQKAKEYAERRKRRYCEMENHKREKTNEQ